MQIAEQLVKNGITSSDLFSEKLTEYVRGCTKIIETGTNHGTGTTRAILNGLSGDFEFFSIEVNPNNFKIASVNLRNTGVQLMNGLSVAKNMIPVNTSYDLPDYIIVDHLPENRDSFYMREVTYNVPDNLLDIALKAFEYKPDFVCLDSAGNMGLIEFNYLMARVTSSFILALDDTCHIKHYHTMEYIKERPEKFKVLWSVESEFIDPVNGSKFGAAIIQVW